MRWTMPLFLTGCVFVSEPCADCRNHACEDVAIRDDAGELDECDYAACEMCVDTCGRRCAVLESYPPQYSCGDDGSWSVYSFCPDWELEPAE